MLNSILSFKVLSVKKDALILQIYQHP